jgi:rhodanese-related sulfurtransferase
MPDGAADHAHHVSLEELSAKIRGGAVLVDVLPRESFLSGHIPGSVSLPLAEIPARAREILPDLDAPIIVYCGGNS